MAPRRRSDAGASKRSKRARLQLEDIQCGRDGPLASVIRELPRQSRIALAATSSAMMAAVLESCDGARWRSGDARECAEQRVGQTVARRVEGRVSEGTRSEVGWATGRGVWLYHRAGTGNVGVPSAVVRVEARDRGLPASLALSDAGRRKVLAETAERRRELASAAAVTAEMTGLQYLDVGVYELDMEGVWGREWLPAGVAAGIRELRVGGTRLERVPEGMVSLEVLDVSWCSELDDDLCLPASSVGRVRVLKADYTSLRRVPEGMCALEELSVRGCRSLDEACLPASSAAGLRVLRAEYSTLRRPPAGMRALRELHVDCCKDLQPELALYTLTDAAELRVLDARETAMRVVPEGLTALEELNVSACASLDVGSLRNAPTVRVLRVNSAGLRRVPEELTALEELDLSGFSGEIAEGFFPARISARLRGLSVSDCPAVRRVPEGLTALEEVDVSGCKQLDGEAFLPASYAARLRVLRASRSNVRKLPRGMDALEELDVSDGKELDWEDAAEVLGGAARLRVLRARNSNIGRLPGGLHALEELYVSGCKHLTGTLEQGVADRLRRWDVRGSGLVLPKGMEETHYG